MPEKLRLLEPHAEPHHRAGVFAEIYTVAYLSFGVPAVVAGQPASRVGLLPTVDGYAAAVLVTTAVGVGVQASFTRRDRNRVA